MTSPAVTLVRQRDLHRLVPAKYTNETVLAKIADTEHDLSHLFELDDATNDRLLREHDRLPGIGVHELVFGVPYFRIVNAAFTHAHPLGSRFNGPERGAWYASFEIKTAQVEVAFHKATELAEVGVTHEEITYDDYLADLDADLHDLRDDRRFATCLDPASYVASQKLAARLLDDGSSGVVYPSVRRQGGTCVACFRPTLVMRVRKASTYRFVWSGTSRPTITKR